MSQLKLSTKQKENIFQPLKGIRMEMNEETRRFYQRNDLESDIPMRRDAFKLAVAYQIEYMHEAEATTTFGMQEPDSWSIGRMSVSKGKGSNEVSLLSGDAMLQLSGTGLLYRGVSR